MKTKSEKAIALMSGGIDSAACAAFLKAQGMKVTAIFIDYGHAAAKCESQAARSIADKLDIEFQHLEFSGPKNSVVGGVAGRNAFLIFAALLASKGQSSVIGLGLHAGTPYYDCSPAFFQIINRLVAEYTDKTVQVVAPFIEWSKRDVFDYFLQSNIGINLTYSCESGTEPRCGQCASCFDRKALGC